MRADTEYDDVQVDYRLATSLRQGDDRRLREAALGARRAAEAEGVTRNHARGGRS